MNKRFRSILPCIVLCAAALSASDSDGRPPLKLMPAPKEVQLGDGGFQVGPRTKIFVQLGHQSEDRIAAETLAEEVADQSGLKLNIRGMKAAGKAGGGAIVLARLQDARGRRGFGADGRGCGGFWRGTDSRPTSWWARMVICYFPTSRI